MGQHRDRLWAAAAHAYDKGEQYWLTPEVVDIDRDQAKQRLEQEAWVECIEQNMVIVTEASIKDAFQKCFPDLAEQNISTSDLRLMSNCLSLAGWLRNGKFNSGSSRNQVRFINPSPVLEQSETNYEFKEKLDATKGTSSLSDNTR